MAYFGEALFSEDIVAWTYGPVVPVVYNTYKKYRKRDINTAGITDDLKLEPQKSALFDKVYLEYSRYSAVALMQMTHSSGPWPKHAIGEVLPKNEIRDYFMTLQIPNHTITDENTRTFDEEYMRRLIKLSAPSWKGVGDADVWVHDLRKG